MSDLWAWLDTVPPDIIFYLGCGALALFAFLYVWRMKP